MELISFLPQTGSYLLYYPKTFLLDEASDGIVSVTSPETASNLTISGYQLDQLVTKDVLVQFLSDITADYKTTSKLRTIETSQDNFFERTFTKGRTNWIFWALSKGNQIIIISINSEDKLSKEDYNLYRFMIDQMEIYPGEME